MLACECAGGEIVVEGAFHLNNERKRAELE